MYKKYTFITQASKVFIPIQSHLFYFIRKNSEISLHFSMDDRASKHKGASLRSSTLNKTPEILLTDCDEVTENVVPSQTLKPAIRERSRSDSSLTDVENVDTSLDHDEAPRSRVVRIDIDGSQSTDNPSQVTQGTVVSGGQTPSFIESTEYHNSSDTEQLKVPSRDEVTGNGRDNQDSLPRVNFLTGMAKTFHQWRTKTKKKRKFNYEKYIIYLESILPTVGFSIGGVIITFNGIYTFIVVLTFLVGVFAQEAFFGN